MLQRLKAVLPIGWFPTTTAGQPSASPVLDALLSGCAVTWAWAYSLLGYVQLQARRLTMTGIWLDLLAGDFFNGFIARRINESDQAFSIRIGLELFREKVTRAGLIAALTNLTGRTPRIFEPAYPLDTGGYGHAGMTAGTGLAYNAAGGYGSLLLPFQFFVTAFRPGGNGVANVAGYYTGSGWAGGGYGIGAIEYASTNMVAGEVTDAMIYAEVNDVRPIGTVAWTAISN